MVNKVTLLGNVGKTPETKTLENGTKVTNFTLATSESYKNKEGEKVTKTEWHNIVAWKGLAGVIETYVKKGHQLYIEGKITTRSWDDKDGNKKYMTEIVCSDMKMLTSKHETTSNDAQPTDQVNASDSAPEDQSLPF